MAERKAYVRSGVSKGDFLAAWERSANVNEVAAATGMTKAAVQSRANYYKKKGDTLKEMGRSPRTTAVAV